MRQVTVNKRKMKEARDKPVSLFLGVVALAACLLTSRSATRLDPFEKAHSGCLQASDSSKP